MCIKVLNYINKNKFQQFSKFRCDPIGPKEMVGGLRSVEGSSFDLSAVSQVLLSCPFMVLLHQGGGGYLHVPGRPSCA
jgi:hypothetical protein